MYIYIYTCIIKIETHIYYYYYSKDYSIILKRFTQWISYIQVILSPAQVVEFIIIRTVIQLHPKSNAIRRYAILDAVVRASKPEEGFDP